PPCLAGVLALCVLLGACLPPPAGSPGPSARSAPRPMRYLALGDSYTIGEGVAERERWPAQLAALLRAKGVAIADPEIIARTGWTTEELAAAVAERAPRGPYALVSLLIGVNDQYRGGDAETYRPRFAALLAKAIAYAGGDARRVIILSIPDWGASPFAEGRDRARIAAEIDRFNAVNREETERLGARYVDITPGSRKAGASFSTDGLHPSGDAYEEWAQVALAEAMVALEGTQK